MAGMKTLLMFHVEHFNWTVQTVIDSIILMTIKIPNE
jgi:hypothetical protein